MAQIKEEIIVIRFSQLVRDGAEITPRVTEELITALAQVAEELVGAGVVVEIDQT